MKLYCCYYYIIYIVAEQKRRAYYASLYFSLDSLKCDLSLVRFLLLRIRQLQILEQLPFIPTLPHAIEAFVDHFLPD